MLLMVFQCFMAPLFCTATFLVSLSEDESDRPTLIILLITQLAQSIFCLLAIFGSCVESKVPWQRSFGTRIEYIAFTFNSVAASIVAIAILATCHFSDNKLQVFYLASAIIQFVFLLIWISNLVCKC